jgi:YidC/Oxa1 family membrane protein insertase
MQPQQPKMFDSRFIMAILLIGICWMGWQSYLAKKYPQANKKIAQQQSGTGATTNAAGETVSDGITLKAQVKAVSSTGELQQKPVTLVAYENPTLSFEISSVGMGLKNVKLNKFTDRDNSPIVFAKQENEVLFSTGLLGQSSPLNFTVQKVGEDSFVGEAEVDGMKLTKTLHIDPAHYVIDTTVEVANLTPTFSGLATNFAEKLEAQAGGLFKSRFEHQEFFVNHEGSTSRITVDPSKSTTESYSNVLVAAFGSQYFASAIYDQSEIAPKFEAAIIGGTNPTGVGSLRHERANATKNFAIKYTAFVGPKSFELLKSINTNLTDVINFGFFTSIAKGIFWLMKLIHSGISNWGLAIIVLTLLVRLVVLPVNILSYKQMKTMSRIQPQIKEMRERYKNDTQRLNQEMLALMKENKANPLGGCLPMFLQIPIFFALYQVIGQSIELYKEPFVFWIQDLSAKDPYFVLPALMGVTMFVQQKITPNTMDPAQQKVMMVMPVIFTFLVFSLPSGLTLYIFVSSVFGILQQIYFTKDKNVPVVVKT